MIKNLKEIIYKRIQNLPQIWDKGGVELFEREVKLLTSTVKLLETLQNLENRQASLEAGKSKHSGDEYARAQERRAVLLKKLDRLLNDQTGIEK